MARPKRDLSDLDFNIDPRSCISETLPEIHTREPEPASKRDFDTQFPPNTPLGTILDALPEELAKRCSCSEDWQSYEHAVGAINMLRTQLDRGFISVVHARECAKDLWSILGDEDEDESDGD